MTESVGGAAWGRFVPELADAPSEAAFRRSSHAVDATLIRLVTAVTGAASAMMIRIDWLFCGGTPAFELLLVLRLASIAYCLLLWRVALTPGPPWRRDLLSLGLVALVRLSSIWVATTRTNEIGHQAWSVLSIIGFWALLPSRFWLQAAGAAIATFSAAWPLYHSASRLPAGSQLSAATVFVLANVLGGTFAWMGHRSRRREFLALCATERARAELAQALGEVRTLKGLVPICAACKDIRDAEGHWHKLEAVLARQTEAQLTHGLCEKCLERLYPDEAASANHA